MVALAEHTEFLKKEKKKKEITKFPKTLDYQSGMYVLSTKQLSSSKKIKKPPTALLSKA